MKKEVDSKTVKGIFVGYATNNDILNIRTKNSENKNGL